MDRAISSGASGGCLGREFCHKRITVMGLGAFGGGTGVARFLVEAGARVTVTDLKPAEQLSDSLKELSGLPITYHLGGHMLEDFTDTDLVVVNPAVPDSSKYLEAARRKGVALDTEMNIFFRLCPARIAAVTGSNGKSTTAALLAEMLKHTGRTIWFGGNIGESLLPRLGAIRRDHLVVLEISSFQLERLAWIRRSPHLAIVLNLTPNHLDRHGTMRAYARAKQNILRFQKRSDFAVLNRDDPIVSKWGRYTVGKVYGFGTAHHPRRGGWLGEGQIELADSRRREIVSLAKMRISGPHNRMNAAAAATAAWVLGATPEQIEAGVASFKGLPDRLELVATVNGVDYVNDSIATTPESAIVALRSFDRRILLIAGGYDKHIPLDEFGNEAAHKAHAVFLMGQTANTLHRRIAAVQNATCAGRVYLVSSLAEAVERASRMARRGDVVLLSPACASYDMFRNYRDRAEQFKALVHKLRPRG